MTGVNVIYNSFKMTMYFSHLQFTIYKAYLVILTDVLKNSILVAVWVLDVPLLSNVAGNRNSIIFNENR